MNCPVCNRSLAPTLSICLTCGAMVKDSVREELQTKINRAPAAPREPRPSVPLEVKSYAAPKPKKHVPADIMQLSLSAPKPVVAVEEKKEPVAEAAPKVPEPVVAAPPKRSVPALPPKTRVKYDTSELKAPKTSPTLVGFQPKNPVIPDWRLELQNKVRGRHAGTTTDAVSGQTTYQKQLVPNGANALKAEYVEAPKPAPEHRDPRVANALKRINESRKAFLPEASPKRRATAKATPNRSFPFNVVEKTAAADIATAEAKATVNVLPKPKLVQTFPVKKKFDTNKLPPIEETLMPAPPTDTRFDVMAYSEDELIHVTKPDAAIGNVENLENASGEIDDLAPFAMRFNSGVFDLIIGGFASMLLLSPIAFSGSNWLTATGALVFAGVWAIVMFLYMTATLGLHGRTLGMRLFSLELVDAVENEYPTLQQAAVNTALFILTLPFAGAGFVTCFFNEEHRAVHDLLSGTILVREF